MSSINVFDEDAYVPTEKKFDRGHVFKLKYDLEKIPLHCHLQRKMNGLKCMIVGVNEEAGMYWARPVDQDHYYADLDVSAIGPLTANNIG